MSLSSKHFYEFGPFRIDLTERVLFRAGRPVPLPPKTFDTLVALLERRGHIVEKDELMKKVWPDTFVEEVNLARHVSNLRKALGAEDEDQLYIETVPRRGYRFVADVTTGPLIINEGRRKEATGSAGSESEKDSVASVSEGTVADTPSSAEAPLGWIGRHKRALAAALAVMVVAAAVGFGLYRWLNQGRANHIRTANKSIPFTTYPGAEIEPVFSPDGSRIAFVWNGLNEDNFDIYVQLINAGPPLRLTSSPEQDMAPAWSPDGSLLAYTRVYETEKAIFTIPAMGGPERKILPINSTEPWLATRLSWTPDGKFIAFSGKESSESSASICLVSIETREQRQLLAPSAGYLDTSPVFSPDGKTLAFIRRRASSNRELYVVPVSGGEPKRLTNDSRMIDALAWTPDSREIVFASNRDGAHRLWRIPILSGTPELLPVEGDNLRDVAISLRGNRLSYRRSMSDVNIWRWERVGSAGKFASPTNLIASTRADNSAQYSPDGKKIAFATDRSGSQEIWICNSEGADLIRLTYFGGPRVGSPRWSPDGRQIAFDCTAEGPRDIYIVSADGGPARRFTSENSDEVRPSWSRDGRWIYFGSNRTGEWQVWKARLSGGPAEQVTRKGGYDAVESPDARFVYYSMGARTPGLWRVAGSGGEESLMIDRVLDGKWAVIDQGIYFLTPLENRKAAVEFFSFTTERISRSGEIENELNSQGPGFSVFPDGKKILCSRIDRSGSDIMLVENFR